LSVFTSRSVSATVAVQNCFTALSERCRANPVSIYSGVCGLVVRVPAYRTEMYRVCCEVRTEFIYVM
jgi:hypothetical protein